MCRVCAGTEEMRAHRALGSVTWTVVESSGGGEGVSGGAMSGEGCLGSGFGFGFRARGLGFGLGFSARISMDGDGVCSCGGNLN